MRERVCRLCGSRGRLISLELGLCPSCARDGGEEAVKIALEAHARVRGRLGLPPTVPKDPKGVKCSLCSNECSIPEGGVGYCGLRRNVGGRLEHVAGVDVGLLYSYYDPLPTNCCAAWFCPGSREAGYNLAVFFYGCNFDCLFCQNSSHKSLVEGYPVTPRELADRVTRSVRCICYFGGSPEPQLPYAIKASEEALARGPQGLKICWEWNGCGNRELVRRAAELSLRSGGNVKFDLKAYSPTLSIALSGVDNRRAYENFEMVAREFYPQRPEDPVLTATTLLVPGYVDEREVDAIASFIADLDPTIPYSLLIFYGCFAMRDLPVTPVSQVVACYKAAKRHLERVHVGNLHLIGVSCMAEFKARFL
ncbi:amidohydrolase [Candidatus Geothermarchaeota archaeon ex4572_27]|nr:MAG: amidohydrolase [Candidatus Geothermarchaeota archaeon ex4572_27]